MSDATLVELLEAAERERDALKVVVKVVADAPPGISGSRSAREALQRVAREALAAIRGHGVGSET